MTASTSESCPVCGGRWQDGATCETAFHQMLFWESEDSVRWEVHHLTVLCYHLQHPHLYSPDGLIGGLHLLTAFVRDGTAPAEIRRTMSSSTDSKNRTWKVTARPDSKGAYVHPVTWTMRASDVVARGADHYCDSVRVWAHTVYTALQAAGNLV